MHPFDEDEMTVILQAAHLALKDSDVCNELSIQHDISDEDMQNIRNQIANII